MTTNDKLLELIKKEARIEINVRQDDTPLEGNVLASGDENIDHEAEREVARRLEAGDIWAWASVEVVVYWRGLVGRDHLGPCNYRDEADFKAGGYYEDMVEQAAEEVRRSAESLREVLS